MSFGLPDHRDQVVIARGQSRAVTGGFGHSLSVGKGKP
jgi:hypothetical protein